MGSTCLIMRTLTYAENKNYQTLYLDFSEADQAILADLDRLLLWFAYQITYNLGLKPDLDRHWQRSFIGSKGSCTHYFQDYLLPQVQTGLVLGLDELNELFQYPDIAQEFIRLLQSWHQKAKSQPIWQKLHIILSISTEIYLNLNIHHSPIARGKLIQLKPFNQQQVTKLAQSYQQSNTQHSFPQLSPHQLQQLMAYLGGHPYLVQQAFHHLAIGDLTFERLMKPPDLEDRGIYSKHLQHIFSRLKQHPNLVAAFEQILYNDDNETLFLELEELFKLKSLGLIKKKGHQVTVFCELYGQYFRRVFA
jgi:hypothetical protein